VGQCTAYRNLCASATRCAPMQTGSTSVAERTAAGHCLSIHATVTEPYEWPMKSARGGGAAASPVAASAAAAPAAAPAAAAASAGAGAAAAAGACRRSIATVARTVAAGVG
jgi:hypothetical protein